MANIAFCLFLLNHKNLPQNKNPLILNQGVSSKLTNQIMPAI
jgi:hypothetical protein